MRMFAHLARSDPRHYELTNNVPFKTVEQKKHWVLHAPPSQIAQVIFKTVPFGDKMPWEGALESLTCIPARCCRLWLTLSAKAAKCFRDPQPASATAEHCCLRHWGVTKAAGDSWKIRASCLMMDKFMQGLSTPELGICDLRERS